MLSSEIGSIAALHVPGTGKLHIHRLRHGLVNATYRVERDGGSYALRVPAANACELGLDRGWEARVLERAVPAGLAPALAYCDPQRGILITRWVDGRSWSAAQVRSQANISRMALLLRRIHALPMPTPMRILSPATWIEHYCAAIRHRIERNPGGSAAPTGTDSLADTVVLADTVDSTDAAALRSAAGERLAALAVLPSAAPVVCHSDLHTFNLIDCGQSLILLDWEYAHASDPLWDLAGWSANNDLEEELQHQLLASYAGRPPTGDECMRLQLLGWLYDYVCWLWAELYLDLQRDPEHGEAPGDAAREGILARCRLVAARLHVSK
jgi:thiamine kinase